jgi:glycerol-3-phosphate acyltransferase PlsY
MSGTTGAFIWLAAGYLFGSIPTAYLVVRATSGTDIRSTGSGNVGAMNSYEITGSKWLGLVVAIGDLLKGLIVVLLARAATGADWTSFWFPCIALIGVVLGHNYNIWLSIGRRRLAGGKGLAAAGGGFIPTMPLVIPVWLALFGLGYLGFEKWRGVKDVIPGLVFATVLLPIAGYVIYDANVALVIGVLALLVLPRNVAQMRALLLTNAPLPPLEGRVHGAAVGNDIHLRSAKLHTKDDG